MNSQNLAPQSPPLLHHHWLRLLCLPTWINLAPPGRSLFFLGYICLPSFTAKSLFTFGYLDSCPPSRAVDSANFRCQICLSDRVSGISPHDHLSFLLLPSPASFICTHLQCFEVSGPLPTLSLSLEPLPPSFLSALFYTYNKI